jgi:hypothetical protein
MPDPTPVTPAAAELPPPVPPPATPTPPAAGAPPAAPPAAPAPPPVGGFSEVPEAAGVTATAEEQPPPPIFTAPLESPAPDLADEFTEAELPPEAATVAAAAAEEQAPPAPEKPAAPPDPDGPIAGLLCMVSVVCIDYIGRNIMHRDPPAPSLEDVKQGKIAWAPYASQLQAALGLDSDGARLALWHVQYGLPRTFMAPRQPEAPSITPPAPRKPSAEDLHPPPPPRTPPAPDSTPDAEGGVKAA